MRKNFLSIVIIKLSSKKSSGRYVPVLSHTISTPQDAVTFFQLIIFAFFLNDVRIILSLNNFFYPFYNNQT